MYKTTLEQQEEKIIYHRKLLIPAQEVVAENYQALQTFLKGVSKQDKAQMVLVRNGE